MKYVKWIFPFLKSYSEKKKLAIDLKRMAPNYLLASIVLSLLSTFDLYAQFTPGRLVVVQTSGSVSKANSAITLNEYQTNGTSGTSVSIPSSGSTPLQMAAGSGGSEGFLTKSSDGKFLVLAGYKTTASAGSVTDITASSSSSTPRAVAKIDASGNYTQIGSTTSYYSANDIRSAVSDGTNYWAGGAGTTTDGVLYFSPGTQVVFGPGATPVKPYAMQIFNSNLYYSTQKAGPNNTASNLGIFLVGSNLPTSGTPTITQIINTGSATPTDFSFSNDGKTCYVAINSNDANGGIQKWTNSTAWATSGWTKQYTLGTGASNIGAFGLTVDYSGSNAIIYATTMELNTAGNRIIKITDSGSSSSATTLVTGSANTWFHGIAFAPCDAPSSASVSSNSAICAGSNLNLTSSASGSSPFTYAWTGPNSFTSTSQNPSITAATTAATGTYNLTITNGCGTVSGSTSVTVNASPTSFDVTGGGSYCENGSGVLVGLSGSVSGVSYQLKNGANAVGSAVAGTGNSISFGLQTTAATYTVVGTSNGCSSTMNGSATATITTNVTPIVSISSSNGTAICSGSSLTFTASPTNGGSSPSYQWKVNGSNVGSNSATYTTSSLSNNDKITCVLTSSLSCVSSATATSNELTISVTNSVTPSVSIALGNGDRQYHCKNSTVQIFASQLNGGSSPSFEWYVNNVKVNGQTTSTFSSSSLNNADVVKCVLTSNNACASVSTATSNSYEVIIYDNVTPSVSIEASATTICTGTNITFSANISNGGSTPTYQWKLNGNNIGSNLNTYESSSLANNDKITCVLTSNYECLNSASANSNEISITVKSIPTPSISGTLSFCSGNSTTLDAGDGYQSYAWSTGETTQTVNKSTAASIYVTVSNGTCEGISSTVNLTVNNVPSQPSSFTASSSSPYKGQKSVTYTVPNVEGVTYTWAYSGSGATINGTGNSITIDFALTATSGTLTVVASNACGNSSARTIDLTLTTMPGAIRITEYMYNGGGTSGVGEYVELTNVGGASVDMTGWSFDDNSRTAGSQSLSGFGAIQPGESVILTDISAGTFKANWNLCSGVKVLGGNTNNLGREDEINIYDASNTLVDRLTYGDQTYSSGSIRTTLVSGYVSASGIGNNTITQWSLSSVSDVEGSYASTLNEVGSPGKSSRVLVTYDPCTVINNAPTIALDVTNTSNYIDGGVGTSPSSPFAASAVLSDPTDPLKTLGISFTINDSETAASSLVVSATSSNTSVVNVSKLVFSGSGSTRLLTITPSAVGRSTITVSVSDGLYSTSYVISYAVSAASLSPSNTTWSTGMSDASDGIRIDDNYFISGDDELDVLNVYSRANSGLPVVSYDYSSNLALPEPSKPEVDLEAGTPSAKIGNRIYWLGSMSNGKAPFDNKPNRNRIFATSISNTGASTTFSFVGYYGSLRERLIAWGDANGYNFTASAAAGVDSKTVSGFAAEGMVFGPDSTTLYIAMRAPLVPTSTRDKAVIAPISNFETWFNNGSPVGSPTFANPIELDLGGRGFRDLIRLSNGTYVIVAGDPGPDAKSTLYKWSGVATDAPIRVNTSADGILNMEGAVEIKSNGKTSLSSIQIISDGGDDILYNDAIEAKSLSDLSLRKFRSDVVNSIDLCMPTKSSVTASACNSYTWFGTTYTNSGSYTHTLNNAAGCDSVITLNLTINTGSTNTVTASACNSYTWFGTTYTNSGSYTHTMNNAAGCDSVITLNLTIKYSSTSTSTVTATNGYVWNGTTYTQSGTYQYTTLNARGCDSVATLNLTVNNTYPTSIKPVYCGGMVTTFASSISAVSVKNATAYKFKVSDGDNIEYVEKTTPSFNFAMLSSKKYATTYTIQVAAKLNGLWTGYSNACSITTPDYPTSKVKATQCNTTLATLSTTIGLDAAVSATGYRVKLTNGGVTETIEKITNSFKLTDFTNKPFYATTYSIEVAPMFIDSIVGYGTVCTVTTPTVVSGIQSAYCDNVLSSITSTFKANTIAGAQAYRFIVSNGINTDSLESTSTSMSLSKFSDINLKSYGTQYSVSVRYKLNDVWLPKGPSCSISTPTMPLGISTATCTLGTFTASTKLVANSVTNATKYKFLLTYNGQRIDSVTTTSASVTGSSFKKTTGKVIGRNYGLQVAVEYKGVFTSYSEICALTYVSPLGLSRSAMNEIEVKVYPNPFHEGIVFESKEQSEITVKVFDMTGRNVSNHTGTISDLNQIKIGNDFTPGVYQIQIENEQFSQSIRMIKE